MFGLFKKSPQVATEPVLVEPWMLAHWPIYAFIQPEEPFKTWHDAATIVPTQLRDLFWSSAQGYMFYLWYLLIYKQFGREVAAVVRTEQAERLNRLGNDFGQQLEDLVSIVESAMQHVVDHPSTVPGQPDVQIPPEYYVALRMLTNTMESPYYVPWDEFEKTGKLPDMHGHDFTLAECLCHSNDHSIQHFTTGLATMAVDARALSDWVDDKFNEFGISR